MSFNDYRVDNRARSFIAVVYGWMSFALIITSAIAYLVANNNNVFFMIQRPGVIGMLIIFQLLFVISLAFFINRMSYFTALVLYILYAASLGFTLSSIFYIYTYSSIVSAFLTTALTFACMSVYGYLTKTDLTTMGNMLVMILVGLIIGMFINFFFNSPQVDYVLSGCGVVIFVLLTAYDTQKIKMLGKYYFDNAAPIDKAALIGALTLYLDFINLFLFILRFMGRKNEN